MKKIISKILTFVGGLLMVFTLVGCGVSQSTANKINDAAKAKDPMTWNEVVEILGSDFVADFSVGDANYVTGRVVWYQGYETYEEVKQALESGKTVKKITVDFLLGEAKSAEYEEISQQD